MANNAFRTDKVGDETWLQLEKNSILLHSFCASSHYEAMTNYYELMEWGVYTTECEIDKEPYQELLNKD